MLRRASELVDVQETLQKEESLTFCLLLSMFMLQIAGYGAEPVKSGVNVRLANR